MRETIKNNVKTVLKFISGREREWSLIFFNPTNGINALCYNLISESYAEINDA